RRVLRSLIVPLALLEIPESINLYSWEVGKVVSDAVVLTTPYAQNFDDLSFEDCQWAVRKIAALSRDDIKAVIAASHLPDDVSAILVEKVIARGNQFVDIFQLHNTLGSNAYMPFTTLVTTGFVTNGKVTRETYDGYAARFAHGDPDSPLRWSEIGRYAAIQ